MGSEPYITPGHLVDGKHCGKYDYGILCFRGYETSTLFMKALSARRLEEDILRISPENMAPAAYETELNGRRIVAITGVVFGGPQTARYVEEMKYLGVEAIVGVTIAAGITSDFEVGEHFYVDEVVCLDGVSTTYYEREKRISTTYAQEEILSTATGLGIELKAATGASVDAIYHETPEIIHHMEELNVNVMNLDVAPFIATAKFRGIEAIMLGYVSDCFQDSAWTSWKWDQGEAAKASADILVGLVKAIALR